MAKQAAVWEMIAMYVTALPCPPLPLFVTEEEEEDTTTPTATTGEEEEEAGGGGAAKKKNRRKGYSTTHDLIGALLIVAMDRGNKRLNALRKTQQEKLTEELLCGLEGLPADDNGTAAFPIYQRFVGGYIHAFSDPGEASPSVRLAALESVQRNDTVHRACCSWSAAQDIQHEPDASKRRTAAMYSALSFRELLAVHARRVNA
jgi:hypothetical protein